MVKIGSRAGARLQVNCASSYPFTDDANDPKVSSALSALVGLSSVTMNHAAALDEDVRPSMTCGSAPLRVGHVDVGDARTSLPLMETVARLSTWERAQEVGFGTDRRVR